MGRSSTTAFPGTGSSMKGGSALSTRWKEPIHPSCYFPCNRTRRSWRLPLRNLYEHGISLRKTIAGKKGSSPSRTSNVLWRGTTLLWDWLGTGWLNQSHPVRASTPARPEPDRASPDHVPAGRRRRGTSTPASATPGPSQSRSVLQPVPSQSRLGPASPTSAQTSPIKVADLIFAQNTAISDK